MSCIRVSMLSNPSLLKLAGQLRYLKSALLHNLGCLTALCRSFLICAIVRLQQTCHNEVLTLHTFNDVPHTQPHRILGKMKKDWNRSWALYAPCCYFSHNNAQGHHSLLRDLKKGSWAIGIECLFVLVAKLNEQLRCIQCCAVSANDHGFSTDCADNRGWGADTRTSDPQKLGGIRGC